MTDSRTQLDSIQEAYMGVLTEGKEAKFKVGDQVGIGHLHSHMNNGKYFGVDTGVVKSIKGNTHKVEYDNIKDQEGNKTVREFSHGIHSKSNHAIIDVGDHTKSVKDEAINSERLKDITNIHSMLNGHRMNHCGYTQLSKIHVDHIKSLLDKHTEE